MPRCALLLGIGLLLSSGADTACAGTRRVAAEWEPHDAIWMQWPKGQENSYKPDFSRIIDVIQAYEPVHIVVRSASARSQAESYLAGDAVPLTNISWHVLPYDWAWMRDNGPLWVEVDGVLTVQDWGFDGWGGLVSQFAADDAIPCQVASLVSLTCESQAPINERGTLEFNGAGALITSWPVLGDRNPGWTQAQWEALLQQTTGVTQVVWLQSAPASDVYTGGHVDGIARFIDANRVVVSRYVDQSDPEAATYEEAAQIIAAAGFEVLRLDIPGHVTYFNEPMAANYINWLVGNGFVLVSGFGNAAWDQAAKAAIEGFFPGREVHVVPTLEIWYWGGGVHCVTNDQPIPLPEPDAALLLAAGLGLLGWLHRRREVRNGG